MAVVGAGLGVEHDHAASAVAVRDVDLVRRIVGEHMRRAIEARGVVRAWALGAVILADLIDELSVRREVQELVAIIVAADPDAAIRRNMDAVLVLPPVFFSPGGG